MTIGCWAAAGIAASPSAQKTASNARTFMFPPKNNDGALPLSGARRVVESLAPNGCRHQESLSTEQRRRGHPMLPRLALQHDLGPGPSKGRVLRLRALIPLELEPVFAGRGRKMRVDADLRYAGQHVTTKDQRQSHSRPRRDVGLLQQRLERLSGSIRRQLNPFAAAA